jgi:uncharacterized protein
MLLSLWLINPTNFLKDKILGVNTLQQTSSQLSTQEAKQTAREKAKQLSVKLELQADCSAGIWAHQANLSRQILESGDVEEGLKAASAIGDDQLQKQDHGHINPDSFTHGSSKQPVKWFNTGLNQGTLLACNTFK